MTTSARPATPRDFLWFTPYFAIRPAEYGLARVGAVDGATLHEPEPGPTYSISTVTAPTSFRRLFGRDRSI